MSAARAAEQKQRKRSSPAVFKRTISISSSSSRVKDVVQSAADKKCLTVSDCLSLSLCVCAKLFCLCLSIGRSGCGPKEFRGSTHSIAVEQSVSQSECTAQSTTECTLSECVHSGTAVHWCWRFGASTAAADVLAGSRI